MKFNAFLILGVLLKMALVAESGLLSGLLGNDCGCSWEKGVQDSCDGLERVVKKFPQPTYDFGQTILAAFRTQVSNLKDLANSTEPILSNRSVNLLDSLSLLSKIDISATNLLRQLERTLPEKTSGYCTTVENLNETIGSLVTPINKVITNVQDSILGCLKQFNKRITVRKEQRSEKIDFKQLVRTARLNSFTIAFVADLVVNGGETFGYESLQSVAILTFISNLQVLAIHGTNANMGSVLVSETKNVSPLLRTCFEALEPMIEDITSLISSASFESVETITEYLKEYVTIVNSYKVQFEKLLGPFEGVSITEAQVNGNLK